MQILQEVHPWVIHAVKGRGLPAMHTAGYSMQVCGLDLCNWAAYRAWIPQKPYHRPQHDVRPTHLAQVCAAQDQLRPHRAGRQQPEGQVWPSHVHHSQGPSGCAALEGCSQQQGASLHQLLILTGWHLQLHLNQAMLLQGLDLHVQDTA